ncbi:MAG: D-alanine--D-alanine ligase, partial [Bdellovibrionales bacterium]|nr:D-alanine--D-alanine ligase [Bdellovibrionales bacterium]
DFKFIDENNNLYYFNSESALISKNSKVKIDFAIPVIHGEIGESGDIQSLLKLMNIPYFGSGPEESIICFNKISTKIWLNLLSIPNTPFTVLTHQNETNYLKALNFLKTHKEIFIKSSSQGSSIGCYPVRTEQELKEFLPKSFLYSNQVIVEQLITGRELEVSVYEYDGTLHVSEPGEIICPEHFYSYEEKYNDSSKTITKIKADNITEDQKNKIMKYAKQAFEGLNLNHLSRIDFFLTSDNQILLNEINTFPGMTPISMFPKMLEANGHSITNFLAQIINKKGKK